MTLPMAAAKGIRPQLPYWRTLRLATSPADSASAALAMTCARVSRSWVWNRVSSPWVWHNRGGGINLALRSTFCHTSGPRVEGAHRLVAARGSSGAVFRPAAGALH